jgi:hypothetical protein
MSRRSRNASAHARNIIVTLVVLPEAVRWCLEYKLGGDRVIYPPILRRSCSGSLKSNYGTARLICQLDPFIGQRRLTSRVHYGSSGCVRRPKIARRSHASLLGLSPAKWRIQRGLGTFKWSIRNKKVIDPSGLFLLHCATKAFHPTQTSATRLGQMYNRVLADQIHIEQVILYRQETGR